MHQPGRANMLCNSSFENEICAVIARPIYGFVVRFIDLVEYHTALHANSEPAISGSNFGRYFDSTLIALTMIYVCFYMIVPMQWCSKVWTRCVPLL
jgi:hypothetical protein